MEEEYGGCGRVTPTRTHPKIWMIARKKKKKKNQTKGKKNAEKLSQLIAADSSFETCSLWVFKMIHLP